MRMIQMRNIPDAYYAWLREKAKETGTSMTGVIKILIRDEIKKEQQAEAKREL